MKTLVIIVGVLLGVSLLVGNAYAGLSYGMGFSCVVSNNQPTCYGSLRGARLSSDPGNYARFRLSQSGTLSFYASSSGNTYSCSFDSASSANVRELISADFNAYFYIKIDGNGRCVSSYFMNSSEHQGLDRP